MPFQRELRELSFVPRWPIVRTIKVQSVAEHSYYVALYACQIGELLQKEGEWKGDIGLLLKYALYHDVEEVFMSDIPGPVKRAATNSESVNVFVEKEMTKRFGTEWEIYSSLSEDLIELNHVKNIVKVADILDEVFFLAAEIQLGNGSVKNVYKNSVTRLEQACRVIGSKALVKRINDALAENLIAGFLSGETNSTALPSSS